MPPKFKKNTLIMITNIGVTSLEQNSLEEEPFIDKAKYAMKILVEKKIFMQPKDEIGIVTMGDETDNPEDLDNIKLYCEHLRVPNWEMVRYINNLTSTNYPCNWIEALHVALCFIKREVMDPQTRIFLVIFNNFKEDAESIDQYDPDVIIKELENFDELHILFVGENPLNKNSLSERFAMSIIKKAGAQFEKIDDFINTRRFYITPPVNSIAWKANLEWAGLCIPCATYVKVTDQEKLSPWKIKYVGNCTNETNEVKEIVKESIQLDHHRNEVQLEQTIRGYKFGGKYIPLTVDDQLAMKYSGSSKGMQIHGFVSQDDVKLEYWSGSGSRIVVPLGSEDPKAFNSLVKAMVEQKCAAVVRKVWLDNNLPKMGVLFPKVENEFLYLVHIELPFAEDTRMIPKKKIKTINNIVSKEKLDALDNFIDAMTIQENEYDYLNPGKLPNVHAQYHWNALADRAVKPEGSLIPLNDYLKKYLEPPEDLLVKAKPCLTQLDSLFHCRSNKDLDRNEKSNGIPPESQKDEINRMRINLNPRSDNNADADFFSPEKVDLKVDDLDDL